MKKIPVKEMFISTQGEGPYVGYKQLFLRFCGCNLACAFCDTDFTSDDNCLWMTQQELSMAIEGFDDVVKFHSVSFTGGEPLLHSNFLSDFLPQLSYKKYLETNATLFTNLEEIVEYVDIISADIKLPSVTGVNGTFENHEEFFKIARKNSNVDLFAKMVFDEKVLEEEIKRATEIARRYDFPLILQPKTNFDGSLPNVQFIEKVFDECLGYHKDTRLIPQVHKFLDIR